MTSINPHVVLISRNLFGTSRVSGVVRGNDLEINVVRDRDQLTEVAGDRLIVVLVDLDEPIDLAGVSDQLGDTVEKIAYGPHVDIEKLQAAASAGCQVLTRGQFDTDLPTLAKQWSANNVA